MQSDTCLLLLQIYSLSSGNRVTRPQIRVLVTCLYWTLQNSVIFFFLIIIFERDHSTAKRMFGWLISQISSVFQGRVAEALLSYSRVISVDVSWLHKKTDSKTNHSLKIHIVLCAERKGEMTCEGDETQ